MILTHLMECLHMNYKKLYFSFLVIFFSFLYDFFDEFKLSSSFTNAFQLLKLLVNENSITETSGYNGKLMQFISSSC